jgi:CheY-like chemotaxis protein
VPVLVVEDDRRSMFVYERFLAMAGFQVLPARTVDAARRALEEELPAAIVLDVMLEEETTWRFLADVKRDPRTQHVPVLVVTVTNKEERARALGADEFWLKPVDQERLLQKLRSLVRSERRAKVLVIDDDERARYLIAKHLEGHPYELLEARDRETGTRLAREQLPHVILLDFLLEHGTAFDVLDDLKADPRTRGIPVIVVTSQVLGDAERKLLASGTDAVISKQNLSRELAINRIRDALRKGGVEARL